MKWVLMTRDAAERSFGSVVVAAAILVMEMEEVLVARIACAGQMRANWAKMEVLRDRISGTASMTKSTSERCSMFVVDDRRARVASASGAVRRPFATDFWSCLSLFDLERIGGFSHGQGRTCDL